MTPKLLNPVSVLVLVAVVSCSGEKAPGAGAGGSAGASGVRANGGSSATSSGGAAGLGGFGNFAGGSLSGGSVGTGQGGAAAAAGSGTGGAIPQGGVGGASGAGALSAGTSGLGGAGATAGAGSGTSGAGGGSLGSSGAGGGEPGAVICAGGPYSAAPIAKGASVTRIPGAPPSDVFNNQGNDFGIIEGPLWRDGALYFSEFGSGATPNSRILRLAADGQISIAFPDAGTNGLALDNAGELLGANHEVGAVVRLSWTSAAAINLVSEYMAQRFNSPNDIAVRKDGNLYFTDPSYQAPSPRPQSATRVYRLAPNTAAATSIVENRDNPNGIALSPDGNTLYVGAGDGVFSYPVMADGAVGSGTRLTQTSTDGMGVDCAGNLYLTSNRDVVAVSPTGIEIGRVTLAAVQSVTNVAFGGADRKTLYITSLGTGSQRGLFRVELANPGYPY